MKELLDVQKKYDDLKVSSDKIISELKKTVGYNEFLLSSLPYPAMYIRAKDRVIISANKIASDLGVKVGGYCWREFMKAEYLSQKDKEIAAKYPDAVPAEFSIKCSFCLGDECFSDSPQQNDPEVHVFGLIWNTYWIKVSDEVFLHYAVNVTKLKQAEDTLAESNQFNSQIINGAHEGIIVYDQNLKYQIWNPFMENLTGIPASEVIGKHPLDVFPFLKDAGVIGIIEKALNGEKNIGFDIPFSNPKSGKTGWASDTTAPLYNAKNEIIGAISVVRDITERKKAEEELKKHREHLEELVKERTLELEEKNEKLEKFNNVFVGREFRIKELRTEVEELKNKLSEK